MNQIRGEENLKIIKIQEPDWDYKIYSVARIKLQEEARALFSDKYQIKQ